MAAKAAIDLTSEKNPSSRVEALSKTVQIKLPIKSKALPLAKGVVIREPFPQSSRTTVAKVVEKRKRICEEPSPMSKSSSFPLSSSKPSSSRCSSSNKRGSEDGFNDISQKWSSSSSPQSPPLSDLFTSQRKRLQDFWLTPLPGFVARTAEFIFHFFNQAWESWSETITTRHR
ncbi:hypothetical protein Fot_32568 [Forsythia ovata]|uniref:Uncharacterized protein n=1 Tax=Forsythia ovata TaxID=205694 RepID=A0ABD1T874_9LAMI